MPKQKKQSYFVPAVQAGLIAAVLSFLGIQANLLGVVFSYFVSLPLFVAALLYGVKGCAIAGIVSLLGMTAIAPFWYGVVFLMVTVLPTLVFAQYIHKPSKRGVTRQGLIDLLLTYGALLLVAYEMMITLSGLDIGNISTRLLDQSKLEALKLPQFQWIMRVFPALMTISWSLTMAANVVLAKRLAYQLAQRKWTLAPGIKQQAKRSAYVLFGMFLVMAMVTKENTQLIAVNLAIIFSLPFVLIGFSLVHQYGASKENKALWLIVFYGLVFLLGWPVLGMILIGLLEPWLKDRFSVSHKR